MGKVNNDFCARRRWRRVTRLMARDGTNCTICSQPLDRKNKIVLSPNYITFDHIIPRSGGGTDLESNLRLAHRLCNQKRGNDPVNVEDEDVDDE